jgi:sugar phosphate isomerase/epimerase
MYTIRDLVAQNFVGALELAAEIGYAGVGLGDFGGLTAVEVKRQLDRLGLQAAGLHVGLEALENDLATVIQNSRSVQSPYIILTYIPEERRKTLEGWKRVAEELNGIGKEVQQAEMHFCYHNHAFEFERFEGKAGLDWLYELTDPNWVKAELDTYWVQYGGEDPAAYIRKYARRSLLLHIKDMEPGEERFFAEIGAGILDWPAIFAAANESATAWYIVEQDHWRHSSAQSARMSFENLKAMGIA